MKVIMGSFVIWIDVWVMDIVDFLTTRIYIDPTQIES